MRVHAEVFDLVSHINILVKDRRWTCVVSYVFPVCNHMSRFTARMKKDVCDKLYTLNRIDQSTGEIARLGHGFRRGSS